MTFPAGDGRSTEPADPFATRAPTPETVEDMDRAVGEHREEDERARADEVPVFLLLDRPEFERALSAYGLVAPGSLESALDAIPADLRPADAVGLARALVRAGALTRYQASAILQGKAKVLAIGRYLVLDRLGSGGMGLVFRARHRESGDVVALKLLPPSASKQEQAVLRFRREARILAQLDHPNIVASREIGEHGGVHYLVMDHVEGSDLHRVVRAEGPLGVRPAVDCAIQAARGLAAAHERGIVHRDIKPANLMVDPSGVVRVLDLGLARITQAADPLLGPEGDPSLTHAGMIMGTVDFLPPEQSNNSKLADHRADIYALGCTLHYLLTGRPPFDGLTIMERLLAHHQRPAPSLVEARPDAPPALDAAFRGMLAKDPADRPQSMAEVIRALETSLLDGPGADRAPAPSPGLRGIASSAGRAAADRMPDDSDLSGYEVLPQARPELWSPLLDAPTEEVAVAVDRKPRRDAPGRASGLEPSARRRWVGLALLLLFVLTAALGMAALLLILRVLGGAIP